MNQRGGIGILPEEIADVLPVAFWLLIFIVVALAILI
jgi:hypothetical protein